MPNEDLSSEAPQEASLDANAESSGKRVVSTQRVPEVSVITSWRVRIRSDQEQTGLEQSGLDRKRLPGLEEALSEGIPLLDLYLLDHHEVRIYADAARRGNDYRAWLKNREREMGESLSPRGYSYATPASFLASLEKHEIRLIADYLREQMVLHYVGHGIGRRPRITSLATHFPLLSLPVRGEAAENTSQAKQVQELRAQSVLALRAALYLAKCLGCHCVEAVGGSRIPQPRVSGEWEAGSLNPAQYLEERRTTLIKSIEAIFDVDAFETNFPHLTRKREGNQEDSAQAHENDPEDWLKEKTTSGNEPEIVSPYLALELEPGSSYLLSDVQSYYKIWKRLPLAIQKRVGLNADLAHLFLIGVTGPEELTRDYRTGKSWCDPAENKTVLQELKSHIIHMHLSDHGGDARSGGVHASDLAPGQYHLLSHYRSWLEFACSPPKRFSGTVAIELESSFRAEDLVMARNMVRRWLQHIVTPSTAVLTGNVEQNLPDFHEAAILIVDLGNSTQEFYQDWSNTDHKKEDALALHYVLDRVCGEVRRFGGSVMSYTGDGVIALFEKKLLPGATAHIAQHVATNIATVVKEALDDCRVRFKRFDRRVFLTLRCALHWGECFIPTTGTLNDKAISPDVVCTARLCAWLGSTIEPAEPRSLRFYEGESSNDESSSSRQESTRKEAIRAIPERKILMGCTEAFFKVLQEEIHEGEVPARYEPFETVKWERWGWVTMKGLGKVQIRLDRP